MNHKRHSFKRSREIGGRAGVTTKAHDDINLSITDDASADFDSFGETR